MTSTLGNSDVTCSLLATNKLWHHPIYMTCMTSAPRLLYRIYLSIFRWWPHQFNPLSYCDVTPPPPPLRRTPRLLLLCKKGGEIVALPRFSRVRRSPVARPRIIKCLKRKGRDCSQSNLDDAFRWSRYEQNHNKDETVRNWLFEYHRV